MHRAPEAPRVPRDVSLFAGILFSLGSTSAVANIVAGVILTYMRGFKVGDIVRIGGPGGECCNDAHSARLGTKNVGEPPSRMRQFAGGRVTNFSARPRGNLILPDRDHHGYDAPGDRLHAVMLRSRPPRDGWMFCRDPRRSFFQKSLDDFYVTYRLNVPGAPDRMLPGLPTFTSTSGRIQQARRPDHVMTTRADRRLRAIVPKRSGTRHLPRSRVGPAPTPEGITSFPAEVRTVAWICSFSNPEMEGPMRASAHSVRCRHA